MFNSIQAPQYEYVQYIAIDNIAKSKKIAYNTCSRNTGDSMLDNDNFAPTKEDMENARKRLAERVKQGTTKGYKKYFKKLMRSYVDVRSNG